MKQLSTIGITIILLLLGSTSFAQEDINPEWKNNGDIQYGVAIGVTNSTLKLVSDNSNASSDDYASSYTIGVRMDYFFNKNWSIKVMPNYDVRSARVLISGSIDYKYITIPVLANWHFGKNRRWNLHFGPNYSAALDSPSIGSSFGLNIGIGVIIPISSMRFFIELDGINDFKNSEINLTDVNGDPIGSEGIQWQRSAINFGIVF